MSCVDLHAHSTRSDGALGPAEVVRRAAARGVTLLALTDHDDVSGFAEASAAASTLGIGLLAGTEISSRWNAVTVHVVGLGFDPAAEALLRGLADIRAGRAERARAIAGRLERLGVADAFEGAARFAGNPDLIGRMHFARHLVDCGACKDIGAAFSRFLAAGKPGYVHHEWPALERVVGWIRAAGGTAVLAHPLRYDLRRARLRALVVEFRALGGEAIEIATPGLRPQDIGHLAGLARELGLEGSVGSDFHAPEAAWADLGRAPPLPDGVVPVWHRWPETAASRVA